MKIVNPTAPLAGFRNLIINGNFAINQRGYASGTSLGSAAYGHDRWKNGLASAEAYTFAQAASAENTAGSTIDTMVTVPSGGSINQLIEHSSVVGGTYTLSWAGTAQLTVAYFNGSGYVVPAVAGPSPLMFTIPAGVTLNVGVGAGTVGLIQLESGPVATAFDRRPIGVELALCQRYFQRFGGAIYHRFGTGLCTSANIAVVLGGQSGVMRSAPTVASGGNLGVYDGNAVTAITGFSLDTADSVQVSVVVSASGTTLKQAYQLIANNDATAHIDLSAEL